MKLEDRLLYDHFERGLAKLPKFYEEFKGKICDIAKKQVIDGKHGYRISVDSILVASARTIILEEGNMAVPYTVICRDFGFAEDKRKIGMAHKLMKNNTNQAPSNENYIEFCINYLELSEEKKKALKKCYNNNKKHYDRTPNPGTFLKEILTEMRFPPDEIAKVTGVKLESIIYQPSVRKMKPYFL